MGSEHYCLRWNNHQSNLLGVFSQLLQDESLVDVTLACDAGPSVRAHKVVLSACSSYFQSLFTDHPDRHPIVILKDMKYAELKILLEFMYKGEVNVEYSQLSTLLKTAESLKVKGLAEMTGVHHHQAADAPADLSATTGAGAGPGSGSGGGQGALQMSSGSSTASSSGGDKRLGEDIPRDMSPQSHAKRLRLKPPPPQSGNTGPHSDSGESTDGEDSMAMEEASMRSDTPTVPSSPRSVTGGSVERERERGGPDRMERGVVVERGGSDPMPGPSGMASQIQHAPLSLKKETDWNRQVGGGDERSNTGESSEFRELPDQEPAEVGDQSHLRSPVATTTTASTYPCMYCGHSFPSQSKLTRHILSHSLETLKYREQHLPPPIPPPPLTPPPQQPPPPLVKLEALNLAQDIYEAASLLPPPPPPLQPVEVDFSTGNEGQSNVVLCKFCGKSFPDVSSLIQHLPVHTGDRPFKCEFCGKAFKLRHHMKDHARVHTGERPFKCALCGKTFSRSTILKAHEKTHYPKYVKKFLPPPVSAAVDAQSTQSQQ